MNGFPKTDLNTVRRLANRGYYDKATIYPIVDEALICHVGFVDDGQPFVIPMIHARRDDTLYLHGATTNRLLNHVADGNPLCISITILDGIVFARSAFHHSMNYRSVALFGKGAIVEKASEKLGALEVISDHVARGRWQEARLPNQREMETTTVVAVQIESASAKIRTGPPNDAPEDYDLPVWAGVLPFHQEHHTPLKDPRLPDGIPVPGYIADYKRPGDGR
jgi:nitroimidazol reductase NimA-like FMN-containing flavoprotein (pyridoxamine 5'-phosphate oxidase superfamily)